MDREKGGDEKRGSVTERRGLSSRLGCLVGFSFGKLLQAIENVQGLARCQVVDVDLAQFIEHFRCTFIGGL